MKAYDNRLLLSSLKQLTIYSLVSCYFTASFNSNAAELKPKPIPTLHSAKTAPTPTLMPRVQLLNLHEITQNKNVNFYKWLKEFKATALAAGITEKTFNLAYSNIKTLDFAILRQVRKQPEFVETTAQYLSKRVNNNRIETGIAKKLKYKTTLQAVENKFGVDKHILLAIWAMESNYGSIMQNPKLMKDIIANLSVLAYGDSARSNFARKQLIAAMLILQSGKVERSKLKGSWAGAMGQPQFIPTSYLAYASTLSGQPFPDIWSNIADIFSSEANLLKTNGWVRGETWGYQVKAPREANLSELLAERKSVKEWQELGFKVIDGSKVQNPDSKASLLLPDGLGGPVFLVLRNFFIIKTYNNANKYALAVGMLAKKIALGSPKP